MNMPRKTHLGTPILAMLLATLFMPLSAAEATQDPLTGQAGTIEYAGEDAELVGRLDAFYAYGAGVEDTMDVSLSLTAEHLRVEVDETYHHTIVAGGSIMPDDPTTDRREFWDATLSGSGDDDGLKLFFTAIDGPRGATLTTDSTQGRLQPSSEDTVTEFNYSQNHAPKSVDVQNTSGWDSEVERFTVHLYGDFYFSDKAVPFTVEATNKTYRYNGSDPSRSENGVVYEQRVRSAYVYAYNATLEVTVTGTGRSTQAYVSEPSLESDDGATFLDFTGTYINEGERKRIRTPTDIRVSDPIWIGDLAVRSEGRFSFSYLIASKEQDIPGSGLETTLPSGAPAADAPAPGPSTTSIWESDGYWLGPTAVAGTTLLFLLVYLSLRPPFWLVRAAMEGKRYGFVTRYSPRHLRNETVAPRASVIHAVALLAQKRPVEADEFLTGLTEKQRPERPTWAYLMATARVIQGDNVSALRFLRECLQGAPEFEHEIAMNPVFSMLWQDLLRGTPYHEDPGAQFV